MSNRIPFCRPTKIPEQKKYLEKCHQFSGDDEIGIEGLLKHELSKFFGDVKLFFTNSATSALELAAIAAGLTYGDEVIFPSYTYVGVVNAFVKLGIKPVFIDVNRDTLNMDLSGISALLNSRTKAIVPVHYAGNPVDITVLREVVGSDILIIEDAAQAINVKVNGRHLGTFGNMGVVSFDYQKNITCGQGGLLLVNDNEYLESVMKVHDNGVVRNGFDSVDWVSFGSNFRLSEVCMAYLLPQVEQLESITSRRKILWNLYYSELEDLMERGFLRLPVASEFHNGHIFYVLADDQKTLISHLRSKGILAAPHYGALHLSTMGMQLGYSELNNSNAELIAKSIVRLPIYDSMTDSEISEVVKMVRSYYC